MMHEFCHSHSNEFVDRRMADLQPAGERLFAAETSAMLSQAYDVKGLLYESMVRACVVRHLCRYAGPEAAQHEIDEQNRRRSLWVGELSDRLQEYESHKEYAFRLNTEEVTAFRSEDEVPLAPVKVTFKTAPNSRSGDRQ